MSYMVIFRFWKSGGSVESKSEELCGQGKLETGHMRNKASAGSIPSKD